MGIHEVLLIFFGMIIFKMCTRRNMLVIFHITTVRTCNKLDSKNSSFISFRLYYSSVFPNLILIIVAALTSIILCWVFTYVDPQLWPSSMEIYTTYKNSEELISSLKADVIKLNGIIVISLLFLLFWYINTS